MPTRTLTAGTPESPARGRPLKIIALVCAFAGLFIVPFLLFGPWFEEATRAFFERGHQPGVMMAFAGVLLAADPVLPIPSSVIATLLAAEVGLVPAAITNSVALSLACVFGYYVGRSGGWAWERSGRTIPDGFAHWVRRYGIAAVLLCRPVPILAEASLMIAGAAQVKARPLLIACVLTQVALGTAYAFAGSGWGTDQWNGLAVFLGAIALPTLGGIVVLALVIRDRVVSRG